MKQAIARPYIAMLWASVWFAGMVLLIQACGGQCAWQTVASMRSIIAAVVALGLARAAGVKLVFPGPRTLWLRSLAGSLSMVATFYALTHLPEAASDLLVINNASPIWLALLSWPVLGEKPSAAVVIAVVCAVAGVAVMQQAGFHEFTLAHAAAVFASLFTAIAMMGLNRLQNVPSLAIVVHFSAVSTAVCLGSFLIFPVAAGTPVLPGTPGLWAVLVAVGITAVFGQVFLTEAFRGGTATKVSVVGLSQIVMVMLWEWCVQGRAFNVWQLLGVALVLGPMAYLMTRDRTRRIKFAARPEAQATPAVANNL